MSPMLPARIWGIGACTYARQASPAWPQPSSCIPPPTQLERVVQFQQECAVMRGQPGTSACRVGEEVDVVAEVSDDVAVDGSFRCEERHDGLFGRTYPHLVGSDRQRDRLTALRIDGPHFRVGVQDARKEKRVPRTPGVETHAVDVELVL